MDKTNERDVREWIERAYADFDDFYLATRAYRDKCAANEEYWRANHWAAHKGTAAREAGDPEPVTPVLFSTLESVLADMMDSYPEAVLLGEEPDDDTLAGDLTQIVQFVLKRREFRSTYRKKCRSALKKGTSVLEVFWDDELLGGLGDINIREVDIAGFLWDPAFAQLQDGRACIKFAFYPPEWYARHYPHAAEALRGDSTRRETLPSDLMARREEQDIMLMEYWFKERDAEGIERVHMLRLAGRLLLEDSRDFRPEGMYAHGQYPFIVEALYPLDGQPVGLGMIDILGSMQMYADRMDQIIMKNAMMAGRPKMLINRSADVDEEAMTDWSREVVRAGRIDDGAVRWFQAAPLGNQVFNAQQMKLAMIKEESGQNQFSRGETVGGVTAASAIMALQEAGNKRSRLLIEQMNDGFAQMIRMMIELITENYTEPRRIRVRGSEADKIVTFDQTAWLERGPVDFDISIQVQRQTPYRTLYQNELAMQLMKAGMIGPEDAFDMMVFEGKDRILQRRRQMQEVMQAQAASSQNELKPQESAPAQGDPQPGQNAPAQDNPPPAAG